MMWMNDLLKMPTSSQAWKINDSQVLWSTHKYHTGGTEFSIKSCSSSYLGKNLTIACFANLTLISQGWALYTV